MDNMPYVATRRHNIDLMRKILNPPYEGYDIIIVSSSTEEEANYWQWVLDDVFGNVKIENKYLGNNVLILSVVDPCEGGQVIGQIYTLKKAEELARMRGISDLRELMKKAKAKVAIFHNGGKGERASPMTQSLGNSRGAQKLVGSVRDSANRTRELELLLAVILNSNPFASTNNSSTIDTFWTSQLCFGPVDFRNLSRMPSPLNKFVVEVDKKNVKPRQLHDFGTALMLDDGTIITFFGNKQFARRDSETGEYKILEERRSDWDVEGYRLGYDFGSFTISAEMMFALYEYWEGRGIFEKIKEKGKVEKKDKRDIDPHFTQPMVILCSGLVKIELPEELPSAERLRNLPAEKKETTLLQAVEILRNALPQECQEELKKSNPEAVTEAIEFYLLYRDRNFFKDLKSIVGSINLGANSHWFTYRRPVDIANEKFIMLSDLLREVIEIDNSGGVVRGELNINARILAEDARRMRGISDEGICMFSVNGKNIVLTFDQVRDGVDMEGVYIKGSVVHNCHLLPGSKIVNSVVNNFTGKIDTEYSYVESSVAIDLVARNSVVHRVIERKLIIANREIVSDAYRPDIKDKGFPPGQARMRVPIGYDPQTKVLDEDGKVIKDSEGRELSNDMIIRTEGGRYTFSEIREMSCKRSENERVEDGLKQGVIAFIFPKSYQNVSHRKL